MKYIIKKILVVCIPLLLISCSDDKQATPPTIFYKYSSIDLGYTDTIDISIVIENHGSEPLIISKLEIIENPSNSITGIYSIVEGSDNCSSLINNPRYIYNTCNFTLRFKAPNNNALEQKAEINLQSNASNLPSQGSVFSIPVVAHGKGSWKQVQVPTGTTLPNPRYLSSLSAVPSALYMFGGQDNLKYFNDLWVLNNSEQYWKQIIISSSSSIPEARSNSSFISFGDSNLYLFGGKGSDVGNNIKYFNDIWSFIRQEQSWKKLDINGNSPLGEDISKSNAVSIVSEDKKSRYIYIILNTNKNITETYRINLSTHYPSWEKIGTGNTPIFKGKITSASTGRYIYLFGINNMSKEVMWSFDTVTNHFTQINKGDMIIGNYPFHLVTVENSLVLFIDKLGTSEMYSYSPILGFKYIGNLSQDGYTEDYTIQYFNKRLYIFGGQIKEANSSRITNTTWIYE